LGAFVGGGLTFLDVLLAPYVLCLITWLLLANKFFHSFIHSTNVQ